MEPGTSSSPPSPSPIPRLPSAWLTVKLTDFGIGQVVSAECLKGVTQAGFTQTMLGTTGTGTGTTMYLVPEIIAGYPATTRSDIYSLGVVLYQLLIGDFGRPLTADWTKAVSDPLLREDLEHCFAWNTADRFPGVVELARRLRQLADRRTEQRRRAALLEARERAAYVKGILKATGVAAAVGLIMIGLCLVAVVQSRRASRAESATRQRAYAAEVRLAHQALLDYDRGRAIELLARQRPSETGADLRGWEWRYLWEQCRSEDLVCLPAHSNRVSVVVLSGDGRFLGSGGADHLAKIWDANTHQLLATLPHRHEVYGMAFSPDRRFVASSSLDNEVRVWRTADFRLVQVLTNAFQVYTLRFSPDGSRLAGAGQRGLRLWDTSDWAVALNLPVTDRWILPKGLAFTRDGQTLAYYKSAGAIELVDPRNGRSQGSLASANESIHALDFTSDGRLLASASFERTVRIWDVSSGSLKVTLKDFRGPAYGLAFSPDDRLLATACTDRRIILWDTSTWQARDTLDGHLNEVWSVAFLPDGERLVSGGKDYTVRVWPATDPGATGDYWSTGHRLTRLPTVLCPEPAVCYFLQDGERILELDFDTRAEAALHFAGVRTHTRFSRLTASPNGKMIVLSDGAKVTVTRRSGHAFVVDRDIQQPGATAMCFDPSGEWVGLAFTNGMVELICLNEEKAVARIEGVFDATESTSIALARNATRMGLGFYYGGGLVVVGQDNTTLQPRVHVFRAPSNPSLGAGKGPGAEQVAAPGLE